MGGAARCSRIAHANGFFELPGGSVAIQHGLLEEFDTRGTLCRRRLDHRNGLFQ